MNTLNQLLDAIHNSTLTRDEEALLRCQAAYELDLAGDYEAAREHLKTFWPYFGERPITNGLTNRAAAELLLRTGSLTGRLGASYQLAGAQDFAKDLLGESGSLFESLKIASKVFETRIEIAWCYWHEGKFDETIALIQDAINRFEGIDNDLRAIAFFRMGIAESDCGRQHAALKRFLAAEPLIESSKNHTLQGRYYNSLGITLRKLSCTEKNPDEYIDRALIYYAVAAYHFEEAHHYRCLAGIENNLGYLLYKLEHFDEAEEHINKGRELSARLNDYFQTAIADDSFAQLLISRGDFRKAERVINSAISILEKGDNKGKLLESLITQATIAVRLGKDADLRNILHKVLNLSDLDFILQQISKIAITPSDDAQLRCALAKDFEYRGEYEQARKVMGRHWQKVGERPNIDGLNELAAAEVLLLTGMLTGQIGRTKQLSGAQELAKDLLIESQTRFEALKMPQKVFETKVELSLCYCYQGAFGEADAILSDLSFEQNPVDDELIIVAAVRRPFAAWGLTKHEYSIRYLSSVEHHKHASSDDVLKGRFYICLALAYKARAASEADPSEYLDCALIYYTAAAFHCKKAGNKSHFANVENNLGLLLLVVGRHNDAELCLRHARSLYIAVNDIVRSAYVDDSLARVLLAQNNIAEANDVIKTAIITLRRSDADSYLAETLITQGVIQSRLNNYNHSLKSFNEAALIAERVGDNRAIVRALISMIEELKDFISTDELVAIYDRADQLLENSQAAEEKERLRKCAKFVVGAATEGVCAERDAEIILESFERRLIPASSPVLSEAQRCAVTEEPVLISGKYELGKKTLAHAMHKWSGRGGRFVSLSCAMLGERPSRTLTKSFASAEAGTVLLENVEELDARAQGMIQRLVETGELHSTSTDTAASRPRPRVIATTSRNLSEEVAQGRFSASLYYSLSMFEVDLSSFGESQLSEH